ISSDSKSKNAREREATIQNLKEMGGGFQLSLEDMRIRGAGEILGEKQHGALETFGYNMYIKMLKEEMAKLKGEYREENENPEILVMNHGYIPDDYIEKDEKIVIYKRMVELEKEQDLRDMKAEIEDRFGKAPPEVEELFSYLSIKMKAVRLDILKIEEKDAGYLIQFDFTRMKESCREFLFNLVSQKKAVYHKALEAIIYKGELRDFLGEYEKTMEAE
ncbi:MAG: transcription-repair coupling factor, partial [Fusobacteriaceae bacterium]|nr:transcription-repair coupling factor [Fusobacteriaceae bacterium]